MEVNIDYALQYGDPRLESYPLMQSPLPTIALVVSYLVFVKVVGPFLMQNRKPYQLRIPMLLYNIAISGYSAWMFIRFFSLWAFKYELRCPPIDYSYNEDAILALNTFYAYYLSKFMEFLDTIFFVLRKKDSQITFLHVFHHAVIPVCVWYGLKHNGGGYGTVLPMVNVFVHIWMYMYYGLSAIGPSMQKYLWWKKYLTTLQLIQFVSVMAYIAQMVAFPTENCNIRAFPVLLTLSQVVVFFVLFVHFYIKSYVTKKPDNIKARMLHKNGVHTNGVLKNGVKKSE